MRHALITPLASRDGSVDKDEKLVNCYGEQDPVTKETFVFKRAGIDEGDAVITGNDFYGQGAFSYGDDLFVIIDDILFRWDYVGGLDYGGGWVYVFGSQSGAGGAGGGAYYVEGNTQDYDISVTYDIGDKVVYEGKKYYAQGQSTGETPGESPLWGEIEPGAQRYRGTITSSGYGTGPDCASRDAAGYAAYISGSHNSCADKYASNKLWYEWGNVTFDGGVWRIYLHQWVDVSPYDCSGTPTDLNETAVGSVIQVL